MDAVPVVREGPRSGEGAVAIDLNDRAFDVGILRGLVPADVAERGQLRQAPFRRRRVRRWFAGTRSARAPFLAARGEEERERADCGRPSDQKFRRIVRAMSGADSAASAAANSGASSESEPVIAAIWTTVEASPTDTLT